MTRYIFQSIASIALAILLLAPQAGGYTISFGIAKVAQLVDDTPDVLPGNSILSHDHNGGAQQKGIVIDVLEDLATKAEIFGYAEVSHLFGIERTFAIHADPGEPLLATVLLSGFLLGDFFRDSKDSPATAQVSVFTEIYLDDFTKPINPFEASFSKTLPLGKESTNISEPFEHVGLLAVDTTYTLHAQLNTDVKVPWDGGLHEAKADFKSGDRNLSVSIEIVPEPGTLGLLAVAFSSFALARPPRRLIFRVPKTA